MPPFVVSSFFLVFFPTRLIHLLYYNSLRRTARAQGKTSGRRRRVERKAHGHAARRDQPSTARLLDGRPVSGAGGRFPIRHGVGGFRTKSIHSFVPSLHPPPCARWPGTPGSWLAGHCLWVLVWTGACYWHGVGGFMFKMVSQFVTIVTRLGADKCGARAVDGPQAGPHSSSSLTRTRT